MKRKLVSTALCFFLLLSALLLFSCGQEDINLDDLDEDDNTRSAVTLNFYIITDEHTTDEAVQLMEAAFNEISEMKYRTRVEFTLCTAEEYQDVLEEKFASIENGEVQCPGEVATDKGAIEYVVDELGQTVIKFPEVADGQIDILLINSREMLQDYVEKGRLMALNDHLDGAFKSLRSYINTDLYNNSQLDGAWYAVPNNKVLGSYTYLLIDRDAAKDSYLNEEDFYDTYGPYNRVVVNYERLQKLIEAVATKNKNAANFPGYKPVAPLYAPFDFPAVDFWTEDGSPSLYATFYDADTSAGDYITLINPLTADKTTDSYPAAESYISYLRLMAACRENGYCVVPDGGTQGEFAVAMVQGDYGLRNRYEDDYFVLRLDNPRLNEDDMFSAMLAVSSYTRSSTRAMEIISDLTTSQELRNILQYGVEGTHFTTTEVDGVVMANKISNDYRMNLDYTGNAFMSYPLVGVHEPTVWVEGMIQNGEALRMPTFGCSDEFLWEMVQNSIVDSQAALLLQPLTGIQLENGNLEEYTVELSKALFQILYKEHVKGVTVEGEITFDTDDAAIIEVMQTLVDDLAQKIADGVSVEAGETAEGVILDAREYSDAYMERLNACMTVKDFEEELEKIRVEMSLLPIFSNENNKNGTPISLYIDTFRMQAAKFTLAGALRSWWFETYE